MLIESKATQNKPFISILITLLLTKTILLLKTKNKHMAVNKKFLILRFIIVFCSTKIRLVKPDFKRKKKKMHIKKNKIDL